MASLSAGIDAMSTQEHVVPDIEQVLAYTAMSPEEFARSWTLECVSSDALSIESPKHGREYLSSSDNDDTASVHTITYDSSLPALPQSVPFNNDEAPPQQQQKSSRPPRQLRPRSTIQLKPFTIERAQYTALVRRADYDELLRTAPRTQQHQRQSSSSYRARSPSMMEEYIMTQDNDGEYDYDQEDEDEEEDAVATVATQDDNDEEIMTQKMRQIKMSLQPVRREQQHQPSPVSTAINPFGAKSVWPKMSKTSPLHTYSKKRKRGSGRERHRPQRRRPAPRITEEAEDDVSSGVDDDANSLDSTLLAADPLRGQGIVWGRANDATRTASQSGDQYDVFAFPPAPMSDADTNKRIPSSVASQDEFAFPAHAQLPGMSSSSSHTTRPAAERHHRPRKQKENDLDGFVVDDAYDPPARKKNKSRNFEISTKGVLPYSFVRVGHRVTEPKPIMFDDPSDGEDDRKSTSSKSDAEQEQGGREPRRSSFSSVQQEKLTAFFDHRATPRRAVSLSPPPQRKYQIRQRPRPHPTAAAAAATRPRPASGKSKLSLSRKKKTLTQQSQQQQQQQHQHPQRRPRRSRNNQMHGIYILPGPSSPERHPYFTTTFRPRERSPIIFPSPDRDPMQIDDTLDSYWWPGLSASPLVKPSSSFSPPPGDHGMPAIALDSRSPLLSPEDQALARFIETHRPFSVDFGALPDTCHRHGRFSASLYLNRDLFKDGTYQIPTHVLGQDLALCEDDNNVVSHNTLRRLFYKCFRDLADRLEGRREEGLHQELEMHNMVTFLYFISTSLRTKPLPHYYEKEITCFLSRVQMLIDTKTCLAGRRYLSVVLIYAMDWLGYLTSLSPPLDMADTKTQLLKALYQLGPDAAHIAIEDEEEEEEAATGKTIVVPKDAVALEAWIFLLRGSSCEILWQQMLEWLERDEALALHERVEKTWHWLFVLRVLLGFDKDGGAWHGLGDPQCMAEMSGVTQLLDDTRNLCSRIGPLYSDYSECLAQRQVRLLG